MGEALSPLADLRVIEISSFVAAPLAGMTLSQLGADVTRIDPLGGSADLGRWPITETGASLYWNGLNKGKRSVTLDLRHPEGQALVHRLVAELPSRRGVVVTNIGGQPWLSFDTLAALCPDLIYVAVEGKSDGSPAVDYTVNASVGFPLVTGPQNHTDPVNHVLPAWDIACGLYAALGVSAAARQREINGEGSHIRVALEDVALATAANLGLLVEPQVNHETRGKIGNHLYGGFARDFRCADDGRMMIVALTKRHWRDLLSLTDREEAATALEVALGVDFNTEDDRYTYRDALAALFEPWFAARARSDVEALVARTSLLAAPYRTFSEAVAHLKSSDGVSPIVGRLLQPGVGDHITAGVPLRGATPAQIKAAPLLGENTSEVLRDRLGIGGAELQRLIGAGVIAGKL